MNVLGPSTGDTALVEAARAGDREAFAALYRRHSAGIARALASYAGPDRTAIDDLVQEVFLRVIENLDRYAPRRPFPHWLYTIALNVGRNHARGRDRVVPLGAAVSGTGSGPAPGVDRELLRVAAVRCAARLPEGMRDVLALRIGGAFSFAEIGEVLDIPEGTARRRMHQALGLLRAELRVGESKERA